MNVHVCQAEIPESTLAAYWLAMTVLAIWPGLGGFWTDHTWVYYFFLQELDRGWAFGGILQTHFVGQLVDLLSRR